MIRLHAALLIILFLSSCSEKVESTKIVSEQKKTTTVVSQDPVQANLSSQIDTNTTKKEPKKLPTPPAAPYPPYDPIFPEPVYPFDPPEPVYADTWIEPIKDTNEVLVIAEVMPEFPGGQVAMSKFIADNLLYPELAKEMQLEGKVYLRFVVKKDGTISDVTCARGIHPVLDKEAIRVVKLMPKWNPAKQNEKAVNCQMIIPIKFSLD
ncbi:MAG: energy transducer TonB [Bacteroidota bacterium]